MMRAASAAVLTLAIASATVTYRTTWTHLSHIRDAGISLTPAQREHAAGQALPLPIDRFDFYHRWLHKGDVYWFDVQPGGFSRYLDLPGVVAAFGRFYLLPAVQTGQLAKANVVLSWDTDPGLLGLKFTVKAREGKQVVFVSRIRGRQ